MTVAEMGSRGSRPGELHRRQVVLLTESIGFAAVLKHLLSPADRLSRLGSLRELAESRTLDSADMVVLDVADEDQTAAVEQVRRRYLGPMVVVLDTWSDTNGSRLDDNCTLLARPFSIDELGAALAIPGRPAAGPKPLADTAAWPPPRPTAMGAPPEASALPSNAGTAVASRKAARTAPVRQAAAGPSRSGHPGLLDRAQRLLANLTHGWQTRRRVQVAGFTALALVAFTAAFALAVQGRCGSDCDLLGTGFSPAPTIAPSESSGPSTTGPKRSTTTIIATTPTGSPGTGAFRAISGGRLASTTTSTEPRATTTSRKTTTTRPATTRPSTTQTTAPPSTGPTTTQPPGTTAPPPAGA